MNKDQLHVHQVKASNGWAWIAKGFALFAKSMRKLITSSLDFAVFVTSDISVKFLKPRIFEDS